MKHEHEDQYSGKARIIQMMPVTGWYSVYDKMIDDRAVDSTDGEVFSTVACWVLMERIDEEGGVHRWVSALDEVGASFGKRGSGIWHRCTEFANFKGFRYGSAEEAERLKEEEEIG